MQYNILYILNESALGGAALSLMDMLKGLVKRNIHPIVVIPQEGIVEKRLQEIGVNYYIVYFSNGYGKIGASTKQDEDMNFMNNYVAAVQLQEIIKREKIQLIHINSSVSNVGAFAAIMANIPYVWHIRELLEEHYASEFLDKELKMKLFADAGALITISDYVQRAYKRKYDVNTVRIYDGVDTEKYYYENNEPCFDRENNNFIITGMITPNKGQWDAVKAVKKLVEEGINKIHLDILGNGSSSFLWIINRYIKENHLEEYISIHPFQVDLSGYRRNCQYALTTSKDEALGRCTIEAMLAGHVVIGANTGGTAELLGSQMTNGYLYEQGDSASLTVVMKEVIYESADKKKKLIHRAQNYALRMFDLDKYSDKIIALYESVLGKKQGSEGDKQLLQILEKRYQEIAQMSDPVRGRNQYQKIINKWEQLSEHSWDIKTYFTNKGIKKLAIYGMGNLGCKLYDAINSPEIQVVYVVDRESRYLSEVVCIKKTTEELSGIDMLVITVSDEEAELVNYYKDRLDVPVVGISEIVYDYAKEHCD